MTATVFRMLTVTMAENGQEEEKEEVKEILHKQFIHIKKGTNIPLPDSAHIPINQHTSGSQHAQHQPPTMAGNW